MNIGKMVSRKSVDVINAGIQVKEEDFKRTFISMKFVRKFDIYATHADENGTSDYMVRIMYGESALDTLTVLCANKKDAEDLYDSLIRMLS